MSHKDFTPEARRIARVYGIRCLFLDVVDPTAPDRPFPDVQSLWGKGWEITIVRVEIAVAVLGQLPPEHFKAFPSNDIFLDDGTELGSAAQLANTLVRTQQVIDKMATEAQPEHGFVELVLDNPTFQGSPICVQKIEPLTLRTIERIRVVGKCKVTVDEFPLRHGVLEGLRVAWGTGSLLGRPAMLVATRSSDQEARISRRFLSGDRTARTPTL